MKKTFPIFLILLATTTQAQLVVQSGATLTTTGNAVVSLLNTDLQNNGTINQLSGTGRFVFNGNSSSVISGTSQPNFAILEMAKTGSALLTLQQNIGINDNITFTAGIIELNNKNIILAPTALLVGESETSRITGTSGGFVEISNTLNAPIATNLGNLGAVITSTQNLGSTTIRRGHVSQTTSGGIGSSIFRYFDITPTNNTALNATLRINYFDAELNTINETNLVQLRSPNAINWSNVGFTLRNATLNFVELAGNPSFERWTLSNATNALPVILQDYYITCNNGNAVLQWKTAQEINSNHFVVQASQNSIMWQNVATIPAAGNSVTPRQYTYTAINNPSQYYRLLMVDVNGTTVYSNVLKLMCLTALPTTIKLYPNPTTNMAWVTINVTSPTSLIIKLVDAKGNTVQVQTARLSTGANTVPLSVKGVASGIYQVQLVWNNGASTHTEKLLKL